MYFPGYTFKKEVELEKNMIYKKAGNDLSAIVKEKTDEIKDIEITMESNPKENYQSFSTKHSTQQCQFPLSNDQQTNLLKNSVMTSSKTKMQPQQKMGTRTGIGKPMGPSGLKIKLIPGVRGDSKEGKRSTSSNKRFK